MQRSSFIPNRTWLKKRSRAPAYTSHLVTVPAGYNLLACLTFFGCSPVTRVELELNLGVKVSCHLLAWRPGDLGTQDHVTSPGDVLDLYRTSPRVEGTVSNRTPVANRNGLNIHFLSWYFD